MREALLVIDLCNDFVADKGALTVGKPAQAIIPFVHVECYETMEAGGMVLFCTDNHVGGIDGKWPKHCDPATDGVKLYGKLGEFYEKFKAHPLDVIHPVQYLPKTKYNAFSGTALDYILRKNDVQHVKLVGVCTDICVFGTAAGAFEAGYDISVYKQGVATLPLPAFEANVEPCLRMIQQQFFGKIIE